MDEASAAVTAGGRGSLHLSSVQDIWAERDPEHDWTQYELCTASAAADQAPSLSLGQARSGSAVSTQRLDITSTDPDFAFDEVVVDSVICSVQSFTDTM